jgi:DNA-binding LytR/AlgR family response regulator
VRRIDGGEIAEVVRKTIDIRDGKRMLRVSVGDVVAVHAAGNYVEYVLIGGGRPLARKSLAQAHRELGEREFVRIHRSWAVNASHVRELRATGAGDYQVELAEGIEAPLSRRFPQALTMLLNPAQSR